MYCFAITEEAILDTGSFEVAVAPVDAGLPARSNRIAAITISLKLECDFARVISV